MHDKPMTAETAQHLLNITPASVLDAGNGLLRHSLERVADASPAPEDGAVE